jgi:predicted AAA+ superfamily ATPase
MVSAGSSPLGEYAERIVRGGFPEAVARTATRGERFFDSYVGDLITRDISQLADIERPAQMRALLRLVAARAGQLLVGMRPRPPTDRCRSIAG